MTALDNRERAFENQFAHQQDLKFKATARRSAMLGHWAGTVIGLHDVDAYARDLAQLSANEPHRLLEKLSNDLAAAGVAVTDREIEIRMGELLDQATAELLAG